MRVFVFEFFSGGGWWRTGQSGKPGKSLLVEGKTMLASFGGDLAAVDGVEVSYSQDRRLRKRVEIPGARQTVVESPTHLIQILRSEAPRCDYGVIIAPEFDNHLHDLATKWTLLGGQLLGPSPEFIRLAGSKHNTCICLAAEGVPVPRGHVIGWPDRLPQDIALPAVLKPDDGAGSFGHILVRERRDGRISRRTFSDRWRYEEYCPGLAASVALLCGPAGPAVLPACLQWLSDDSRFRYCGGMTPMKPELNARAQRLALAASAALPRTSGYIGIDLVLGDATDGSGDKVIEVNPRLTTSYVGLRAVTRGNLAAATLAIARGESCHLTFDDQPVQFTPDGQVVSLS